MRSRPAISSSARSTAAAATPARLHARLRRDLQPRHRRRAAQRDVRAVHERDRQLRRPTTPVHRARPSRSSPVSICSSRRPGSRRRAPLPSPFVADPSPIAMGATAGKVALVSTTALLGCGAAATPCIPPALARSLISSATERPPTSSRAAAPRPRLEHGRRGKARDGCQDTDNNAADFSCSRLPLPATRRARATCDGPPPPTNPTAGGANPGSCSRGADDVTVTVTPGTNPTSTGLVGHGRPDLDRRLGDQAFADDGVGFDVAAGDNIFTYRATLPRPRRPARSRCR